MNKRLFFMIGAVAGFLFAKILYRKRMERLAVLDDKEAERKTYYADLDRRWHEELAAMPFEKRMDWELFEASLKSHDHDPDWDDDDYDDEDNDYDDETD